MEVVLVAGCAVAGLMAGEPLEVVVQRTGAHQPFTRPWWRCSACGQQAAAIAAVSLLGAARRPPCSGCGALPEHRRRSVALALVAAAVLASLAARFGADVALAPFAFWALALVALSAVDIERLIIPNRIVYPAAVAVVPLLVAASAVDHRWSSLAQAAIGAAVSFGALLAVHLAYPRGMGFGDVRLAGLVGLGTGWLGLGHTFVAFLCGFALAAVAGIGAGIATGRGRKQRLFFGPFLAAGALMAVVAGDPLVNTLFHRPG